MHSLAGVYVVEKIYMCDVNVEYDYDDLVFSMGARFFLAISIECLSRKIYGNGELKFLKTFDNSKNNWQKKNAFCLPHKLTYNRLEKLFFTCVKIKY